jgi:uncharacterized damage-inducible protein DinB
MSYGVHDLIRHNSWATAQVLAYCRDLDETALNAANPGTYGSILATMIHLVSAESGYLTRLAPQLGIERWSEEDPVSLDLLIERADMLAAWWESAFADGIDFERMGEGRGSDGAVFTMPFATLFTQAIHHGNEHRAQVCTILGALGLEPPEVSSWEYAIATGRMKVKDSNAG